MTSPRSTPNTQRRAFLRCLRVLRCTSLCAIVGIPRPADPAITIVLTDHHFRLSAPVEAGPLTWRVRNEGTEPHQALVVRLPDGVSESAERAWFEHGRTGPEPGERAGGLETIAPDADASFTTNLGPGRYLLLCAMDEEEGRHFELGMIYRFTIE